MGSQKGQKSAGTTVGRVRPQLGIPFGPDAKLNAWHQLAKRLHYPPYPHGGTALARRVLEEFMAPFHTSEQLEQIGLVEHTVSTGGWLRKAIQLLEERERKRQKR